MLRRTNLDGDRQADLHVHGGPDRAVMLYGAAHYPLWEAELGRRLEPGAFGENLTVEGLDEWLACLGDVLAVGEALIQLSQVRSPCYKVAYRNRVPDLVERISTTGRSGFYARVLREGRLWAGAPIELVERPNPKWTLDRARHAYAARSPELLAAAGLAEGWRHKLEVARAEGR